MSKLKLQHVFALFLMLFIVVAAVQPMSASASTPAKQPAAAKISISGTAQSAVRHDASTSQLRYVPVTHATTTKPDQLTPKFDLPKRVVDASTKQVDPAWLRQPLKKYIDPPMPGLDVGLNGANQGTNRTVNGFGVLPPDTNGDVSANHYIQTVNNVFTIWDLNQVNPNTGLPLEVYGPARISSLFTGFGGACETWDDGDPIVLYDSMADRWMISQFALPNYPNPPFSECIAVSQSGDPLGKWNRYEFQFQVMNDYPHFGVWPDGYYMSINQFTPAWAGQGVVVFERAKMLAGLDARMIYINTYTGCVTGSELPWCIMGGMLPSDMDGPLPPAGAPNMFSQFDDDAWGYSPDQLQLWSFATDWTAGTAIFTNEVNLPVDAFTSEICAGYARNCIKQPGTAQGLDAIADRLMYRLQYRNFGTYQTLVTNHTVAVGDVAGHAGVRWYELRQVGGIWGVQQQGTYAPDSASRWMGSAAMDGSGNIAIGYSVSDDISVFPGMRYAGRLASDPLGTLPQTEKVMIAGSGIQTHTAARWGDYSSLSVSPVDDCQFWFTSEYNRVTSPAEWYTYIGAFTYPAPTTVGGAGCSPHSPFTDVTSLDGFSPFIYRLADMGITSGCSADTFCPDKNVTRGQMSVFLLRTEHGAAYAPAAATGTVFGDVSTSTFAADWIEQLASEGITAGCGSSNFCPESPITRAEMAVFLLRAEHGAAYVPPAATGTAFADVSASSFAAAWIEQLAAEGITTGCGAGNFCPGSFVTRGQMAVFLIRLSEKMP